MLFLLSLAAVLTKAYATEVSSVISPDMIGFYMQVYKEPEAYMGQMLSGIRRFYPNSPIVVFSDNGSDFSELCLLFDCVFIMSTERINDDTSRAPFTFTCDAYVGRILGTVEHFKETPFVYHWETDTRALGPVLHSPTHDMMQMASEHNAWDNQTRNAIGNLFPTNDAVQGWSTAGGTLFNFKKLFDGMRATRSKDLQGDHSEFYSSQKWIALNNLWDGLPEKAADCCLMASAMVSGLSVGKWDEYQELNRMTGRNGIECRGCIDECIERSHKRHHGNMNISTSPPHVDQCIFNKCGPEARPGLCPSILHNVKATWAKYQH